MKKIRVDPNSVPEAKEQDEFYITPIGKIPINSISFKQSDIPTYLMPEFMKMAALMLAKNIGELKEGQQEEIDALKLKFEKYGTRHRG